MVNNVERSSAGGGIECSSWFFSRSDAVGTHRGRRTSKSFRWPAIIAAQYNKVSFFQAERKINFILINWVGEQMDVTDSKTVKLFWEKCWEYMVKHVVVVPLMKERRLILEHRIAILEAQGRAEYRREVIKKARKIQNTLGNSKAVETVLELRWNDFSEQAEKARDIVGDFYQYADVDDAQEGFHDMQRVPDGSLERRKILDTEQRSDNVIRTLECNREIKRAFLDGGDKIRCPCCSRIQQHLPFGITSPDTCYLNGEFDPYNLVDHMLDDDPPAHYAHRACLAGLVRLAECFYAGRDMTDFPVSTPALVTALISNWDRMLTLNVEVDPEFRELMFDYEHNYERGWSESESELE